MKHQSPPAFRQVSIMIIHIISQITKRSKIKDHPEIKDHSETKDQRPRTFFANTRAYSAGTGITFTMYGFVVSSSSPNTGICKMVWCGVVCGAVEATFGKRRHTEIYTSCGGSRLPMKPMRYYYRVLELKYVLQAIGTRCVAVSAPTCMAKER